MKSRFAAMWHAMLLALELLFVVVGEVDADDDAVAINVQTQTQPPTDAQFEIIQSSIKMAATFRLNRYTGAVHLLVRCEKASRLCWENVKVLHALSVDTKSPRFQISMSGIAAKGTFLVDTLTGAVWQLFEDKDAGDVFFDLIGEPIHRAKK